MPVGATDAGKSFLDTQGRYGLGHVGGAVGLPDAEFLDGGLMALAVGKLVADQHDKVAFDAEVALAGRHPVAAEPGGAVFLVKFKESPNA